MASEKKLSKTEGMKTLGVAGQNVSNGNIRADEFLPELKGQRAIRKFTEMRDNDPTIGAAMYAVEQMLRDVKIKVKPSDPDSEDSQKEAEFVESVLEDMDHTLDDHVSEALGFLTYGFSWFEVIYKRRVGPTETDPKKHSKYSDNRVGVRKIAPRAPWTVNKFDVNDKTGDVLGVYQRQGRIGHDNYIPLRKSLYYRTTTINGDPSGRSILRNAFTTYERLKNIQQYEAVGIERELAGIPVLTIPADYLSKDATDEQKAVKKELDTIGRDLKFNDQGYVILPSDPYMDSEGKPSNHKLMDFKLASSEGSRNIDLDPVIKRYQHDIAGVFLAEVGLLGRDGGGSYALSKSKTDLFLRTLESYIQSIVDVLNRQLVERLWQLNGLDYNLMPKITAGDIAPHDLKELGSYLRNLNGADISLADQTDIVDSLLENAELPALDRGIYEESRKRARRTESARADYYDDDSSPGDGSQESEEDGENSVGDNAGDE